MGDFDKGNGMLYALVYYLFNLYITSVNSSFNHSNIFGTMSNHKKKTVERNLNCVTGQKIIFLKFYKT